MPRYSSFSNARFVSAADFVADERKQVVIDRVFEETFRNEPVPKVVITVVANNGQRDLTVNQTNGRALADHYGDEMNDWVGKSIELYVVDTEYNGEPRKGVRLAPLTPAQTALPGTAPPTPTPTKDELDDDIPF